MSEDNDALAAAYMAGRYDGRKQAEAELARLTAERDWLADKCAMHCHDKDRDDIMCSDDTCAIQTCWGASECEWKEAARKAVAGEGK